MDPGAVDATEMARALQKAAAGRQVMLIVDDAWSMEPVSRLGNCLDPQTGSHLVVTTRIQALIANDAVEVPLGLLEPEAAARLLLTVAGSNDVLPPYSAQVLKAVEACGRLPLALGVAGGMLHDSFFGNANDAFVAMVRCVALLATCATTVFSAVPIRSCLAHCSSSHS